MLSAAEGAAKMKHHTENKVSIGTEASDVEESNGEEHVFLGGQRTAEPTRLVGNKHSGLDMYA